MDEISIIGNWKLISDIEGGIECVGDCEISIIFTKATISIKEYYRENCSLLVPEDS